MFPGKGRRCNGLGTKGDWHKWRGTGKPWRVGKPFQLQTFSGQLRTKEDNEGQHALLKADSKYELDTVAKGQGKDINEFQARNDRFDFRLNPADQTDKQGNGVLSFADKVMEINGLGICKLLVQEKGKHGAYEYAIVHKDKGRVEAQLSAQDVSQRNDLVSSLFGRRSEKYFCTGQPKALFFSSFSLAETPGVSQCYDAQGRSAGKVVADKSGNTIVYNDKDVPIGTGSVRKISDRSYEVCDGCVFFSQIVEFTLRR